MPHDTAPAFDPGAAGWKLLKTEGYPALIGPYWARRKENGTGWRYGFLAEPRHRNDGGVVHGGMLMSFADDLLGLTVWEGAGRRQVTTVHLSTHFIAPARLGDFVEGEAEVMRATRTLVFVRGTLMVSDRTCISAEGVWKILGA